MISDQGRRVSLLVRQRCYAVGRLFDGSVILGLILLLFTLTPQPASALTQEEVLWQLNPPASPDEVKALREAKPAEYPNFLATRQYVRMIIKTYGSLSAVPSGENVKYAPRPSKLVDWQFILNDDEGKALYKIKLWQKP